MNNTARTLKQCVVAAIVSMLITAPSLSDDIDVYVAPPPEATVGETLVVFTLDVRPNVMASTVCTGGECDDLFTEVGMGDALDGSISFFELLVAALKKVLRGIDSPKVKVALMLPHDDTITGGDNACIGPQGGDGGTCSNGAYVLSAFKSTVQDDPDTLDINEGEELDEFFEKMESIPLKEGGNWNHPYQLKELFLEMFRYLSAAKVFNGRNGRDNFDTQKVNDCNIHFTGDTESAHPDHTESFAEDYVCSKDDPNITTSTASNDTITDPVAELAWDPTAQKNEVSGIFYKDTLDTAEHCTDIFSVNVTFANAQSDHDSDSTIATDFGFDPDDNQRGRLDVLRHLAVTDLSPDPESDTDSGLVGNQNIRSYFITRKGGRAVSTANEWADAGGTGFAVTYEDDPDELVRLLSGLFNEIEGVSTTFVSASVPANVFNRAETLNEVFLAIFEPDGTNFELNEDGNFTGGGPFWVGNVKKLQTRITDAEVCNDENGDGDTEDEGECVPRIVCNDENEDGIIDEATECQVAQEKILVDVLEADKDDPNSAINPLDGRIRAGALTYWTRTGSNNEYLPAPSGTQEEIEEEEKEFTEGTDGRKVARGGAGQVKPGYLGTNSPGNINDTSSDTTMSGPRKVFTEPDDGTDGTSDALVDLDADNSFNTAIELLSDTRDYPGSGLSYGAVLYQEVMSDCTDCKASYNAETNDSHEDTAELRVNNLIRFARGWDVGLDSDPDADTAKRDWWQADPLHSRPLALNYGARSGFAEDRPDIRVIVAGNDGMVQMIGDGRKSDGSEDGVEDWAFLPREFVPLQKRLLQGTLGLYNPGQPADSPRTPLHPYAMDGSPTALVVDNNLDGTIDTGAGDQVYLYLGQRRGGKRYYALDLSDPDDPKYLWSIGKNDADGELAEMGQSWSLMRAGIMQVDEGTSSSPDIKRRPVLVFSGGYNGDDDGDGFDDLGKDSRVENHPGPDGTTGTDDDEILGTDDTEGNALFIVNALTGELIWKVVGPSPDNDTQSDGFYDSVDKTLKEDDLVDSVAASPTALDTDGNGLLDRVYFADTGGNVWRMDAAVADRNGWTVNKLFAGGRHVAGFDDNANDRRFFSPPDVVFASDADGEFDAVILGSGDRAHPLGNVVENWLYMIKDRATTSGDPSTSPLTHNDLADLTENCLQSDPNNFGGCTRDSSASTNITNGWKIQLENCEAGGVNDKCGEKTLASALTVEGEISLTTYLPVLGNASTTTLPDTCGPKEGSGLFYVLDLQTAAGTFTSDDGSTTTSDSPRFDRLDSPGIPPDVVQISPKEQLRPDLKIHETEGRESSDTFWYERKFE